MKFAVVLLLLPFVALAETPKGEVDEAQKIEQMKKMMLPMMEKSIPAMEKTRACIQASGNTADLKDCSEIMRAFQNEMAAMMGRPEASPHGPGPMDEELDIEWSQELKTEMLAGLEQSIKATKAAKGCMESSASGDEMRSCMEQKGFPPRQGKP